MSPDSRWFLRMSCADGVRLLPVEQIIEVLPLVTVERFGRGDGSIGYIHFRGELVALFSPGAPDPVLSLDQYIVLVALPAGKAAILVDDVHEVIEVEEKQCRAVGAQRWLAGVMLEEGFVRTLDIAGGLH